MSNYVKEAKEAVKKLRLKRTMGEAPTFNENEENKFELTTSQIRKILSMTAEVLDIAKQRKEFDDVLKAKRDKLLVLIIYQAGKEKTVKDLDNKAGLVRKLEAIDSKEKLIEFCEYMESIVAYFKYYGGKDK